MMALDIALLRKLAAANAAKGKQPAKGGGKEPVAPQPPEPEPGEKEPSKAGPAMSPIAMAAMKAKEKFAAK
ncbi:MAG TPA: hypothetical protein VK730_13620 [Solirubrobacteraceae bacterium]|jgi:hypothetical protein|nr:hypothetical protein [Solirubrobacteraceae bacterium]